MNFLKHPSVIFLLLLFSNLSAQNRAVGTLEGQIFDASENLLPGATISFKDLPLGTVTDENGTFAVSDVAVGEWEIAISYVGFETLTRKVTILADETTTVSYQLKGAGLNLEQVVVTATRSGQRAIEVPTALSVRSAQAIQNRGVITAPEALQGITGVNVQYYTEGNFPIIRMRGAGDAGILQNTDVLVLIDGIPQVNVNGQSYYNQIPLEGVDRIEVVRGPTSALYGRNGIGGAINIITKQAPKQFSGTVEVAAGSFGTFRPRFSLGGALTDNIRMTGGISYENSDGWRDNANREAFDAFLRTDFDLSDKTKATIRANFIDISQGLASQLPIDPEGNLLAGIDRTTDFGIPDGFSENQSFQLSGNLTHLFSNDLKLEVLPYFRTTDRILRNDGTYIDFINTDAKTLDRYPFEPVLKETIFGVEPRFTFTPSSMDGKLDVTLGGMFENNSGEADSYGIVTDGSGSFGVLPINYETGEQNLNNLQRNQSRDGEFESNIYAAYVQTVIKPADRLSITAGLRYDYTDRVVRDPLRSNPEVEGSYSKLSPQLGISYGLNENNYLFANYGQGFNPPWGLAFTFEREGAGELEPETATNLEFGYKSNLFSALDFSVSYYQMNRTDLVRSTRVDGRTRQVNAGELDVSGIEVELMADLSGLTQGLSLAANYAYTNTEWVDFQIGENSFNGTSVVGSPDHLGSFTIDLNKPNFQVGLWADYVGSWAIDRRNTVTSNPYTVLNARASVKLPFAEGLTIGVTAFNLLDKAFLSRTEFDFSGNPISASPGRPRWFLFTANYTF
ncbi:MAG: TonB-dependent receptor [Bacteroidota bacterium]